MAKLKFNPNGYQDLGAYALLRNVVENEHLVAEDSRPYKVYTALLNQTDDNAPVATVLENTLGNVTFSREDAGGYFAILADGFTANKTFVTITPNVYSFNTATQIPVFTAFVESASGIIINTGDGTAYLDELLINTPFEIRVYN